MIPVSTNQELLGPKLTLLAANPVDPAVPVPLLLTGGEPVIVGSGIPPFLVVATAAPNFSRLLLPLRCLEMPFVALASGPPTPTPILLLRPAPPSPGWPAPAPMLARW